MFRPDLDRRATLTSLSQLKPGGYIEFHEIHVPIRCTEATGTPKPFFVKWSEGLIEGGNKVGLDFAAAKRLGPLLQAQGFTNINVKWQNFPVGPWAKGQKNKAIGRWWAHDMQEVARNTGALFTRVLGWEAEEFELFAAKIANEIDEGKRHMWTEM